MCVLLDERFKLMQPFLQIASELAQNISHEGLLVSLRQRA